MFKKVFKIEKTFGNKTSGKPQAASRETEKSSKKTPSQVVPKEREKPSTMSSWKKFGREQLQNELNKIGLEFRESTERGDCFFDSFAYLLTGLRGDKQYSAQDIRKDISNYLQRDDVPHEKYKKLLKSNRVDANTYEAYKEKIGKGATDGYDPIWGDDLALQLACDIYNVNITVHSSLMLEVSFNDLMDDYEGFPHTIIGKKDPTPLVCTKLVDKSFSPNPERPDPKDPVATLDLAHLARGPWAHFLPAVPTDL